MALSAIEENPEQVSNKNNIPAISPNDKEIQEVIEPDLSTSDSDVENGLPKTDSSKATAKDGNSWDKSFKYGIAACILDMTSPVAQFAATFALDLSPIGLKSESGSWKNEKLKNIVMVQIHLVQMVIGLVMALRLSGKFLTNVSIKGFILGYKIFSCALALSMVVLLCFTYNIGNENTDSTDTATKEDFTHPIVQAFAFIVVRFVSHQFMKMVGKSTTTRQSKEPKPVKSIYRRPVSRVAYRR